ncbi:bombyxin E-1-like [Bombyx mandarina]|uniref:Insulin-like domain-containing protein n=2 Tax=Bombyx TaxID=7090 RepID=A0A8R2HTB5_BOMMO|nr:bombyxin E-1-like [Bombyx mori]XP_028042883.1 bombyxin E-1-like [Bombyx mandarina]
MKTVLLIVLLLTMSTTALEQQKQARHYCGRFLALTLADLCWEYKRSDDSYYDGNNQDLTEPPSPQTAEHRIQKRGVADDCCLRACTLDVLLLYC